MKKLIIMAGLPGSGKSYVRENKFSDMQYVDCDELKKSIKGYDPKNPGSVHEQSKIVEKQKIYSNMAEGISFVYDTTATNSDKVVKMIKEAQSIGYEVTIVYVKTTLATSLERNSKRERVVPESIILEKYEQITASMEIVKRFADKFETVNND